jgi:hypothetical protein
LTWWTIRLVLIVAIAVWALGRIVPHAMDWLHWNVYFLFRDNWLFLLVLLGLLVYSVLPRRSGPFPRI